MHENKAKNSCSILCVEFTIEKLRVVLCLDRMYGECGSVKKITAKLTNTEPWYE